jgi:outer membrane cobalamin receptor
VFADEVVVTARRVEQVVKDVPSSVAVLTRDDVEASSAQTVDGLLTRLPGFSLLRQGSAIVAAPTVRFVSLRGLGGGNSRTLVLLNGVPVNEPFSGVVYWSQIPLENVERIEIVKGGGSGTWGNLALGGVINIITTPAAADGGWFRATVEGGSADTARVYASARTAPGKLRASVATSLFRTGGYFTIREDQRGPVDRRVSDVNGTVNARLEYAVSPTATWFLGGSVYRERQEAPTNLTEYNTAVGQVSGGGTIVRPDGSRWQIASFFGHQNSQNTSSSVAVDRQSETPAGDQFDVPATTAGGSVQWSRAVGVRHLLTGGVDLQWIDASVGEHFNFVAGEFTRTRTSGGRQVFTGLYLDDMFQVSRRWRVVGAVRLDRWQAFDGVRREVNRASQAVVRDDGPPGRTVWTINPSVGLVHHVSDRVSLRTSVYRAFRAPTPAEMYRPFRARGNVIVESNADLGPERLTGVEGGVNATLPGDLVLAATGYWDRLTDSVAIVTIDVAGAAGRTIAPCGFVPAGGVCRQRQNLRRLRSTGLDLDVHRRFGTSFTATARYLFNRSRAVDVTTQPQLAGTFNTHSPVHQAVLAATYEHPRILDVSAGVRYVGTRFEDDLNALRIGSFTLVDLRVARALSPGAEVFVTIQNLLDRTYETTRAADGTVGVGEPRLISAGLRLRF